MKDDKTLQILSKSLTHLIFRNGIVEDMHAGKSTILDDNAMKTLNKDINNRIYTLLKLYTGDDKDKETLLKMIEAESIYGKNWDKAEINAELNNLAKLLQDYK